MTEPQSHFSTHLRNGSVERAHLTHSKEFYEVMESSFDITGLRNVLNEYVYLLRLMLKRYYIKEKYEPRR